MSIITRVTYAILFIILTVHPHFITGHIFTVPQAYAQSIVIIMLLIIAYAVYKIHNWDIEQRERKNIQLKNKLQQSNDNLNDAFKNIGEMNRQLPLLKYITTDLLSISDTDKNSKKAIFNSLLAVATVSVAKTNWALLRFINIKSKKTLIEFTYNHNDNVLPQEKVSNKDLLNIKTKLGENLFYINNICILRSSDNHSFIKCFLILPKETHQLKQKYNTLQIITDQAQLFYQYLLNNKYNNNSSL